MRFMREASRFSSVEARLLFFGSNEKLPDYSREYETVYQSARELPTVIKYTAVKAVLDETIEYLRELEGRITASEQAIESTTGYVADYAFQLNHLHQEADEARKTIAKLTERAAKFWKAARIDVTAMERADQQQRVAGAGQQKEKLMIELIPQIEALVSRLTQESSALGDLMQSFKPEAVAAILGPEPVLNESDWLATKATA